MYNVWNATDKYEVEKFYKLVHLIYIVMAWAPLDCKSLKRKVEKYLSYMIQNAWQVSLW